MANGDGNSAGNVRDRDVMGIIPTHRYRLGTRCWEAAGIMELAWSVSLGVVLSWEVPAGQQGNIQLATPVTKNRCETCLLISTQSVRTQPHSGAGKEKDPFDIFDKMLSEVANKK